jgi:hypothetical protein
MMFCPRCKQLVRRLVFGFACGCSVLSGHAEEPPQNKWYFQHQPRIEVVAISTSTAAVTAVGNFATIFTVVKPNDST